MRTELFNYGSRLFLCGVKGFWFSISIKHTICQESLNSCFDCQYDIEFSGKVFVVDIVVETLYSIICTLFQNIHVFKDYDSLILIFILIRMYKKNVIQKGKLNYIVILLNTNLNYSVVAWW